MPITSGTRLGRNVACAVLCCLFVLLVPSFGWEFVDIDGVTHDTTNREAVITFGRPNCVPLDWFVADALVPIKREYADVMVVVVFPCVTPDPAVAEWRADVPGASNLCVAEIPLWHPIIEQWAAMDYRVPSTLLLTRAGHCATNWPSLPPQSTKWRRLVEVPLTRELNDLCIDRLPSVRGKTHNRQIVVSENERLAISWRSTAVPWRFVTNRMGSLTCYQLTLP